MTAQSAPQAPMIPTHSPDAAKASYSTMTERVIAPPIQAAAKKDPKLANNWKTKPAAELTDDEVKAMPDAEYMNDKQMAFFRHKLSVLKQEIHNSAGETTEHLREDTSIVPDPADRATIEEEHALELRTRDRARKLISKIDQAIATLQRAAAAEPGEAEIHEHLGDALYTAGRKFEARHSWNAALITSGDEAKQRVEAKIRVGLNPATAAP